VNYLAAQQANKLGISESESKKILTEEILLGRFGEPEDKAA
jgi:hypothetical protein